ncbi:hypothetical protein D7030_02215 [Flavobacteriaceae bacterium AU392]|nr:hypothetical protein D1817_08690 [Flavobacteriaceae bacterium]RKM85511.1 hypothetical protein D7030_02215 [Flavobacteriaceae bacterium AU392]
MRQIQKHIIFKFSIVILAFVLLVPSAVKFSHIFKEHVHKTCTDTDTVHIHNTNLDCDFCKFKLNTQFIFINKKINYASAIINSQLSISDYQFYYNSFSFQFLRRGPPYIV